MRRALASNVFEAAVERMTAVYAEGHRVVVSFSGGKDSGICLEVCVLAARATGRLPVEVVMRDDEIMLPGTFEYAERLTQREDLRFRWVVARQPIVNIFNRERPYFWAFDPEVSPEEWVRTFPPFAEEIPHYNIQFIACPEYYPPRAGKLLVVVVGLRVDESQRRALGLHSSGQHLTRIKGGMRYARPIYDWRSGDVWKAIHEHGWDYNRAYDSMSKLGVSPTRLRIAPPTMSAASVHELGIAAKAWPQWFDRVCQRLPGVRTAARFGRRAVEPQRRLGETWKQCFERTCLEEAPEWIRDRAARAYAAIMHMHRKHSVQDLPETVTCDGCRVHWLASYRVLAKVLYTGDPLSLKADALKLGYVEPEFFRPGSGVWGGTPTW